MKKNSNSNSIYFLMVASLISLCLFFVGCTKEQSSSPTTLNVRTSFGEGDGNYNIYKRLITAFQDETGTTILDDSQVSNEEWKERTLALFETGDEPDVLFFFVGNDAIPLIESGRVIDMETIRENYPSYGANISTSVLETMKAPNGNIYAVPVSGYWEGLFVNSDLFLKHNIPFPEDWDSFLKAISEFKDNGIIPIAASLGEIPHYWFEFLIYNYTGPANHLNTIPTETEPIPEAWENGLLDFKHLYETGAFPENTTSITNSQALSLFHDKEAAMLLDGSWIAGQIVDMENVVVIPFPAKEGGERKNTDMIGGFSMGFYITEKAWNDPVKQKAAVDFVTFMTSNESVSEFNKNGAASPVSANTHSATNPLLESVSVLTADATAYIGAVQDTFKPSARNTLFKNIPKITEGSLTIEEALLEFIELNK